MINLKIIPVGPIGVNCYLLSDEDKRLTIIDPGADAEKIISYIENGGYTPQQIFLTHGHWDHVGGAKDLQERYTVPLYVHPDDAELMSRAAEIAENHFRIKGWRSPDVDRYYPPLEGGSKSCKRFGEGANPPPATSCRLPLKGGVIMSVFHTPGHSKGGVCLYIESMKALFSGDTLFRESIGRTDFPDGSQEAIIQSVQMLYTLPDDTTVYPGHGPMTSIGHEKQFNPFIRGN